jgi:valyl-tRNA synthetase
MPFITEELWQRLPHQGISLAVQSFPVASEEFIDPEAERSIAILEDVIVKIRNVRAEMDIEPGKRIQVNLAASDPAAAAVLEAGIPHIQNLARCAQVNLLDSISDHEHSARRVTLGAEVEIPLTGLIDFQVERVKLEKEIVKVEKEILQIQQKLANPGFLMNAPEQVVWLNHERLSEFMERLGKLKDNLSRL